MGSFSLWHWLIVLLVVLILFGRGRVSEIMGDFGKGIKSFKKGLNDVEENASVPPAQIPQQPTASGTEARKDTAGTGSANGGN